jgi:hypothetical protein
MDRLTNLPQLDTGLCEQFNRLVQHYWIRCVIAVLKSACQSDLL